MAAVFLASATMSSAPAEPTMGNLPNPFIVHESVDSTSIESIGFHARRKLLEVKFRAGVTYRYSGVPKSVFIAFRKADSKGRFFSQQIRGRYDFLRVAETPP